MLSSAIAAALPVTASFTSLAAASRAAASRAAASHAVCLTTGAVPSGPFHSISCLNNSSPKSPSAYKDVQQIVA